MNYLQKLSLIIKVYSVLYLMPIRAVIGCLILPIHAVRYEEFFHFIKFIGKKGGIKDILDISSPFVISYILAGTNKNIMKTDINPGEGISIKESKNLKFKLEDGTNLSFNNNIFDSVYSISVIEHIYQRYDDAIKEMIRVCKPGGYIYITTPISQTYTEEWLDEDIYSHQNKNNNRVFFQYRFDKIHIEKMLNKIDNVEIIETSIYRERRNGMYNRCINILRKKIGNRFLNLIKDALIHFYYGFFLLKKSDKREEKNFGNIHFIMKKTGAK